MELNAVIVIKSLTFCGLFAVLVYKAEVQVAKYTVGKTTVAKHYEHFDSLEFPAISICPGFNQTVTKELGWLALGLNVADLSVAVENYPKTEQEASERWRTMTYSMEDIFFSPPNQSKVLERDTLLGKCYTVLGLKPVKHGFFNMLMIALKISPERNLKLSVHDRAATMGLNSLYWTSNMTVATFALDKGGGVDLTITKSVFVSKGGASMDADQYHRALNSWFDGEFRKGEDVCWDISFKSLLSNKTLEAVPPCTDFYKYANSRRLFLDLLGKHVEPALTGLVQPKEIPHYRVTMKDATAVGEDILRVFFFYETTTVAFEEEYVLLDFNGLVANIGGWLGLLVGLSFYGIIELAADFSRSHCKKFHIRKKRQGSIT